METKRSGVHGLVWAMAFAGFAIVFIGYFGVLLQFSVSSKWPQLALAFGLALLVLALPMQYLLDAYHDRGGN